MIQIPYSETLTLPAEPLGRMNCFLWNSAQPLPAAELRVVYNQAALKVRLCCNVGAPLVHALEDNGPVWEDNCMEFFFQPFPDDPEYINFECNALGYMVIGKGVDRNDRLCVLNTLKPAMDVTTTVKAGCGWQVEYTIPFQAISAVYGREFAPKQGDTFLFNAFICCETEPTIHFGAMFDIPIPDPDFHRSEFFGEGSLS